MRKIRKGLAMLLVAVFVFGITSVVASAVTPTLLGNRVILRSSSNADTFDSFLEAARATQSALQPVEIRLSPQSVYTIAADTFVPRNVDVITVEGPPPLPENRPEIRLGGRTLTLTSGAGLAAQSRLSINNVYFVGSTYIYNVSTDLDSDTFGAQVRIFANAPVTLSNSIIESRDVATVGPLFNGGANNVTLGGNIVIQLDEAPPGPDDDPVSPQTIIDTVIGLGVAIPDGTVVTIEYNDPATPDEPVVFTFIRQGGTFEPEIVPNFTVDMRLAEVRVSASAPIDAFALFIPNTTNLAALVSLRVERINANGNPVGTPSTWSWNVPPGATNNTLIVESILGRDGLFRIRRADGQRWDMVAGETYVFTAQYDGLPPEGLQTRLIIEDPQERFPVSLRINLFDETGARLFNPDGSRAVVNISTAEINAAGGMPLTGITHAEQLYQWANIDYRVESHYRYNNDIRNYLNNIARADEIWRRYVKRGIGQDPLDWRPQFEFSRQGLPPGVTQRYTLAPGTLLTSSLVGYPPPQWSYEREFNTFFDRWTTGDPVIINYNVRLNTFTRPDVQLVFHLRDEQGRPLNWRNRPPYLDPEIDRDTFRMNISDLFDGDERIAETATLSRLWVEDRGADNWIGGGGEHWSWYNHEYRIPQHLYGNDVYRQRLETMLNDSGFELVREYLDWDMANMSTVPGNERRRYNPNPRTPIDYLSSYQVSPQVQIFYFLRVRPVEETSTPDITVTQLGQTVQTTLTARVADSLFIQLPESVTAATNREIMVTRYSESNILNRWVMNTWLLKTEHIIATTTPGLFELPLPEKWTLGAGEYFHFRVVAPTPATDVYVTIEP